MEYYRVFYRGMNFFWGILPGHQFLWKIGFFWEKWYYLEKKSKIQKNGWQISKTTPMEGQSQILHDLHDFPQILRDFSDFREIKILSKKHQIWQNSHIFPLFDLENGIFFFWSLNLTGILYFSKFGHLKSNISGFMAQKRPKNCHFWAQNGSNSRNLWGHNSRTGWNFRIL